MDFGAVGDGVADDSAAFEAADQAAAGRRIHVPAGTYHLAETVNIVSEIEFEGTVSMPDDKMLLLTKNFDLPSYIEAFGDEALAFRKAFQALLNNSDHESLDLGGRKISVDGPIDMAAAVPNRSSYATRRIIRNGQFDVRSNSSWDSETFTSTATYDQSAPEKLRNVANVANIPVGSLVQASGVGREVYVRSKNLGASEITLSAPLFSAAGTQTYTFRSYRYLLDFSGFSSLQKFGMEDIEFQCNSRCEAIRLAPAGNTFSLKNCFISRPRLRGITSIGRGCQGMLIDGCQFLSSEEALPVTSRFSVALNANANDIKLRNNRVVRFRHFAVLSGRNNLILGNHFFQGDSEPTGVRTAGLVLIGSNVGSTISGNYVDNCHIEWTNEHDQNPQYTSGFSFSALTVTGNIFLASNVAPWFSFIVTRPHGSGHYLNGLSVTGNTFRASGGNINQVDRVDATHAHFNRDKYNDIAFENNTFHGINSDSMNPLRVRHNQNSASQAWTVSSQGRLPFDGKARTCDSVVAQGGLTALFGGTRALAPYVDTRQGPSSDQLVLRWSEAVSGVVSVIMRTDL